MTPVLASELSNGRYVAWVIVSVGVIIYAPFAIADAGRIVRRLSGWWRDRQARRDPVARDVAAVCRHHRQQRALERACAKRGEAA